MFDALPRDWREVRSWEWAQYAPYYEALMERDIDAENVAGWLADWSRISNLLMEVYNRLRVALDQDTNDEEAEQRYFAFLEKLLPPAETAEQALKEKLLASEEALTQMEALNMQTPLRNLQAEADLFREENVALAVELDRLGSRYQKIVGSQTVTWEGETLTLPQLKPLLNKADREAREQIWRLAHERWLEERQALNELWQEMLALRRKMAQNADCSDFREYQWRNYQRFDYSPEDAQAFHEAIAEIVAPAAARIYERHRQKLGLDRIRPWDLSDGEWSIPVSPADTKPLKPFADGDELLNKGAALFNQVDAELGADFETMVRESLLDLENRPGKAPGGYCTYFAVARRPFILMNAVGMHDDVQTLMHEAGHAFHAFASSELPYRPQHNVPMEFNEVASMAMELLAAPYLAGNGNGTAFYRADEAARARLEHLEDMILFWPYMAVVDAFQHWVYTHADEAMDPAACDAQWMALWQRYMPGVDWSGLEAEAETGWHRKVHIFDVPFYYVEYGIAALGAAQVWQRSRADQAQALADYRRALTLGGTATLPELFATAGAKFAFDAQTVREVVEGIEEEIDHLLQVVEGADGG